MLPSSIVDERFSCFTKIDEILSGEKKNEAERDTRFACGRRPPGRLQCKGYFGISPKTATPLVVATYTLPLVIMGGMNLLAVPGRSRDPAWLLL